jgi:death-on-curing protein
VTADPLDPIFLTVEDVLQLHDDQLERFGGSAGVRDRGALESAVAVVQATFDGKLLHGDIFEMAAA